MDYFFGKSLLGTLSTLLQEYYNNIDNIKLLTNIDDLGNLRLELNY